MKLHFPSLCSIQVEEVEWPHLNSRQRKLLGALSSVRETSDKELEGGGGGRDLGSYDLSDDGFLSFFTRCKSSSPLIEKISLNLGKQGWRLRSETELVNIYTWKLWLEVKITSCVSMFFECSPFLDFFTSIWFFFFIKPASSCITRGHGFCQKIQNKRRIVSRESETLCRRGGLLQNKLSFIDWVHNVNWPTWRNSKAEVLSVSPSLELIATQLIKPLKLSTDFSFEFWKHLSRASFAHT